MAQTILILGAGIGGIVAAERLRRRLPKEHRIVLVDRERTHVFAPSLLWLMTGDRRADTISRPLTRVQRRGVDLITGEIESIDPTDRSAVISGRTLQGDFLIIALGAELAPESVPGLFEAGHNFYTLAGAESLRTALDAFSGGRLIVLTASHPYRCPAAPYEAAMLIENSLRRRGLREQTELRMFAAEPGPMGVAGPEVSAAVRGLIEAKGIGYFPDHVIREADPEQRRLHFGNGVDAVFDLLAFVPPHRVPSVVQQAGLAAEGGYVAVDKHTLETSWERVYALGDVAGISLSHGKPLPKAGVFAHGQAEVVADNIAHAITGKGRTTTFDGHGACFVEIGDGRAGLGKGNFYADPAPDVRLRKPAWHWHMVKILFEQYWLRRWF